VVDEGERVKRDVMAVALEMTGTTRSDAAMVTICEKITRNHEDREGQTIHFVRWMGNHGDIMQARIEGVSNSYAFYGEIGLLVH
jgi:hypothetical protein